MNNERLEFYGAKVTLVELCTNPYNDEFDDDWFADSFLEKRGFKQGSTWKLHNFAVPITGNDVRVLYDSGGDGNPLGGWGMRGNPALFESKENGALIDEESNREGRYAIQSNKTVTLYVKGAGSDENYRSWKIHCEFDDKTRVVHGKELVDKIWDQFFNPVQVN